MCNRRSYWKEISWVFHVKDLQNKNQTKFRTEKVIKTKT